MIDYVQGLSSFERQGWNLFDGKTWRAALRL